MEKIQKMSDDIIVQRLAEMGVPESEREILAKDIFDVLSKRLFVELFETLSDEERFVLNDMLSNDNLSDDDLDQFLRGILQNYKERMRDVIDIFFNELRENIEKRIKESSAT